MQPTDFTYANKLTELRLDISHPKNQEKVFMLLEGPTDVKFYRKLCNTEMVNVEGVPGGKNKLEDCLIELVRFGNRVLGIRDADFSHLEGKIPQSSNLFFTDVHDLELLIAFNDEIFSAVLSEYCDDHRNTHPHIKSQIVQAITFVGYCRWYNERNNLELSFDNIPFSELLDKDSLVLNERAFIERLLSHSPKASMKDVDTILVETRMLVDLNHDLLQVCNGHDFMKALSFFITSKNIRGVGEKAVSANFRIAFNSTHFRNIKLFTDTNHWATMNRRTIYD